jgi:hypothetical protein
MKFSRIFVATGLIVASLGASVPATAQAPGDHRPVRVVTTRTVHTKVVTHNRRGWHRPRCTTKWRHHRKVRVCR